MKKVDNEHWDLKLNITCDWGEEYGNVDEGVYAFNGFGAESKKQAELFAKHLGKVVCGEFMDTLIDELNKRRVD